MGKLNEEKVVKLHLIFETGAWNPSRSHLAQYLCLPPPPQHPPANACNSVPTSVIFLGKPISLLVTPV